MKIGEWAKNESKTSLWKSFSPITTGLIFARVVTNSSFRLIFPFERLDSNVSVPRNCFEISTAQIHPLDLIYSYHSNAVHHTPYTISHIDENHIPEGDRQKNIMFASLRLKCTYYCFDLDDLTTFFVFFVFTLKRARGRSIEIQRTEGKCKQVLTVQVENFVRKRLVDLTLTNME